MKRILLLAIVFVRCACPCEDGVVQASGLPSSPPPEGRPEAQTTRPPLRVTAAPVAISRSRRNPFAYVAPPPIVHIAPVALPQVVEQPVFVPQPAQSTPAAPQFPYRYIGRFGPANDPIAVFVSDGDVRTVRAGERIDERFLLRTIGLETVQIEASGWPEKILVALSSTL